MLRPQIKGSFRPKQVKWAKILPSAAGLSHAEVTRAVDDVIKRTIMIHGTVVKLADIAAALAERQQAKLAVGEV